jgi:hypothetical protein
METDEAMKFVYAHQQVKNHRLACGETVAPCQNLAGLQLSPLIFAEAFICAAGFPASPTPAVIEMGEDQLHIHLEKLMSDLLVPFAKTKLSLVSPRKRRSLYQELRGVHPSSRRIMLSSKSALKSVIIGTAVDPIEKHLAGLLGRKGILTQDLRLFVKQVCHTANFPFDGPRALPRSTKREILCWIEDNWESLCVQFTAMTAIQRTLPVRRHLFRDSQEN